MRNFDGMTRAELKTELLSAIQEVSGAVGELFPYMHKRPALGGVFGSAGFVLCSYCCTINKLQEVRYYVFSEHGLFLGAGATKGDALAMARAFLGILEPHEKSAMLAQHRSAAEDRERELRRSMNEARSEAERQEPKVRSIGRRRQRIFNESNGNCDYCGTALTLDGKWHIEHKMPKALGGGNEPGNLVASCVSCNHKKCDTTDIEFKAKLAKESRA
jgi:5-methylcytosine-specific restriction endonuclease McrA